MINLCMKCGLTLSRAKDNRKGAWLTTRALDHTKKCVNKNHHHSISADKSCVKEEENIDKEQHNLLCTG